jgi:MFS family permease
MMACVTGWFDTHRSLAVSLVSAGMGMAPMTMSPLAAWLGSHYDWRTSMLIILAVAAALMIPTSLTQRLDRRGGRPTRPLDPHGGLLDLPHHAEDVEPKDLLHVGIRIPTANQLGGEIGVAGDIVQSCRMLRQ